MYDGCFRFIPVTNGPAIWGDLPANYHAGACTLVFADAHAEVRRWQVPETKQPVTYVGWDMPHARAASSPDRRDYDWLSQRTAEPHP